jgi:hypothetical protein
VKGPWLWEPVTGTLLWQKTHKSVGAPTGVCSGGIHEDTKRASARPRPGLTGHIPRTTTNAPRTGTRGRSSGRQRALAKKGKGMRRCCQSTGLHGPGPDGWTLRSAAANGTGTRMVPGADWSPSAGGPNRGGSAPPPPHTNTKRPNTKRHVQGHIILRKAGAHCLTAV